MLTMRCILEDIKKKKDFEIGDRLLCWLVLNVNMTQPKITWEETLAEGRLQAWDLRNIP